MAKPDNSRDYYADLQLPSSAEVGDIKKQFRKLALQYHPDRNPGREAEVNSKFQVIQAAHEVLSDPESKAKYDAARRSRYPTASGVRGNPWQDVAKDFPAPPRRAGADRSSRNPPPPPPSGAHKYRNFTSGAAPTAKHSAREDTEARRNAWQAFENMRPSSQGKSAASQARRPVPPRPTESANTRPVPRTPGQKQKAEAAFGARKSGYAPHSPVPGDEPSVSSTGYATNRHTYDASSASTHEPIPDPLAQFRDKFGDDRQSTPYQSASGEKVDPFDGIPLGRAKSTRESPRHEQTNAGENLSPGGGARHRSSSAPRTATPNDANSGSDIPQRHPFTSRASARYTPAGVTPNTSGPGTPTGANGTGHVNTAGANPGQSSGPSIFTFPVDEDTFSPTSPSPNRFARSSADDINTRFVNHQSPDAWQFTAGSPREESQDPFKKRRAQSGSRTGHESPSQEGPPRPPKEPADSNQAPPVPNTKWDAQGWEGIGAQNFAPQPVPAASVSPTRQPTRTHSRKPKVKATAGTAGLVNEESSSDENREFSAHRPNVEVPISDSPNAMDIDSPPPSKHAEVPQQSSTARNIPVEPSKPEWRPGNVQNLPDTPLAKPAHNPLFNPNAAGSEDSDEFRASFADLRNVAPFTQKSSGLNSFSDLKSNLPFESRASGRVAIHQEKKKPAQLDFPVVPRAPNPPPALAVPNLKPSTTAWQKYLQEFQDYMKRWDEFNAQVTDHFSARKHQIQGARETKGYSFLTAQGTEGIQEYLEVVQQDRDIRRKWAAACDDHEQRLKSYLAHRMQMR